MSEVSDFNYVRKGTPLEELLNKVDTACWCWSVKQHAKRKSVKIDWKSAFDELVKEYQNYQLKTSDKVAVLSQEQS